MGYLSTNHLNTSIKHYKCFDSNFIGILNLKKEAQRRPVRLVMPHGIL
jgi:hypothetical protein